MCAWCAADAVTVYHCALIAGTGVCGCSGSLDKSIAALHNRLCLPSWLAVTDVHSCLCGKVLTVHSPV